jgi:hypothetical protein
MSANPKLLLGVGFLLLLLGAGLPFLMAMQVIESTLFLNFFAYICQVVGMIVGFYGAISIVTHSRRDR